MATNKVLDCIIGGIGVLDERPANRLSNDEIFLVGASAAVVEKSIFVGFCLVFDLPNDRDSTNSHVFIVDPSVHHRRDQSAFALPNPADQWDGGVVDRIPRRTLGRDPQLEV